MLCVWVRSAYLLKIAARDTWIMSISVPKSTAEMGYVIYGLTPAVA